MPAPGTSLITAGDIVGDAQVRAKIVVTNATQEAIMVRLLNTRSHELARMHDWWWMYLYQRALQLPARYRVGTVDPTIASATLPGTSTAWTGTNNVGTQNVLAEDLLRVDGDTEIYEVRTVVSGVSITLGTLAATMVYLGDTATGKSYTTWRYLLNLPTDFRNMVKVYDAHGDFTPLPTGVKSIRRIQMAGANNPYSIPARGAGTPKLYTISGTAATKQLFIWPPFDTDDGTIYFDYQRNITVLAVADTPLVPVEFRDVLVHGLLMDYYADLERNDGAAGYHRGEYFRILDLMKGDDRQDPYRQTPVFRPDLSRYRRGGRVRRVYDENFTQAM